MSKGGHSGGREREHKGVSGHLDSLGGLGEFWFNS